MLGDSCTFGQIKLDKVRYVRQPYPLRLQNLIDKRVGPETSEVLNAGLPGYNSYQGLMLLRTKLRGLEPDVITVRFGWNDLLLSRADDDAYREPETALGLFVEDLLLRTALYPFVRRLGLELRALRDPVEDPSRRALSQSTEWKPTIPLERFKHNLGRIVEVGRDQGADVWLLTAPHNPSPNRAAADTFSHHNRASIGHLMKIHDAYNDAVREVGAETGALVVDMERRYRQYAGDPVFIPTDVIHPSQGGHNLEAETLYQVLVRRGMIAPAEG